MMMEGIQTIPTAVLSRPEAGIRHSSIIINFPGSTKAVVECVRALRQVLPHALHLVQDKANPHPHAPRPAARTAH